MVRHMCSPALGLLHGHEHLTSLGQGFLLEGSCHSESSLLPGQEAGCTLRAFVLALVSAAVTIGTRPDQDVGKMSHLAFRIPSGEGDGMQCLWRVPEKDKREKQNQSKLN